MFAVMDRQIYQRLSYSIDFYQSWDTLEFCSYVNIKHMTSIKYEYVISIVTKCWIFIHFFIYFWFEENC